MPEIGINFQKEDGKLFKEIKINSRPAIKKLQCSQASENLGVRWHKAQNLKKHRRRGLWKLYTGLLPNRKEKHWCRNNMISVGDYA